MVSPDGSTVFVADDLFGVAAYDAATGKLLWLGGPSHGNTKETYAWALAPDGSRIFATGHFPSRRGSSFGTVAYDAMTGDRVWTARVFGGEGFNTGQAVTVHPDGGLVFVVGAAGHSELFATAALRASTGELVWSSSRRNRRGASASRVIVDPTGDALYVAGEVGTPGDVMTIAYAPDDGEELWRRRLVIRGGDSSSGRISLLQQGASLLLATSAYDPGTSGSRFVTFASHATTGEPRWKRSFDAAPTDNFIDATVAHDDGPLVLTGLSATASGPIDDDIETVAYDPPSGDLAWASTFEIAGPFGGPEDIGMSPDSDIIYVLGTVWGPAEDDWDDFLLVAYDAESGAENWSVIWGGLGELREQAAALAVDPQGELVYVTGSSADGEGSYDHVVIAFRAR
jgi:outer membrane protein assembly factor BamB